MTFSLADFLASGAIMSLSHDELLVGWGDFKQLEMREGNLNQPVFYFSDFFFQVNRPKLQYANWMRVTKEEFYHFLHPLIEQDPCNWFLDRPDVFIKAFYDLKQLLESGQLQKAVPYLFSRTKQLMTQFRLQYCLQKGLTSLNNNKGYLYGHWHHSRGVLGITPEILFFLKKEGLKTVQTMALAGTCHSSDCPHAFLSDPKQNHEHQIVVQGICQALKPLGAVKVGDIQLLKLPKISHLMTAIEVELRTPFDFDLMVRSLHPTPALGAYPSDVGKEWLALFHHHTPRGFYGAPVGALFAEAAVAQCFVAIRNVQWDPSGMWIGAGCGVVERSCFENEWQEIQMKLQAIRDQFQL